jgi:hypothetical protein
MNSSTLTEEIPESARWTPLKQVPGHGTLRAHQGVAVPERRRLVGLSDLIRFAFPHYQNKGPARMPSYDRTRVDSGAAARRRGTGSGGGGAILTAGASPPVGLRYGLDHPGLPQLRAWSPSPEFHYCGLHSSDTRRQADTVGCKPIFRAHRAMRRAGDEVSPTLPLSQL